MMISRWNGFPWLKIESSGSPKVLPRSLRCQATVHRHHAGNWGQATCHLWNGNGLRIKGRIQETMAFSPIDYIFVIKEIIGMMNELTNTGLHVDNDKNWETSPNHTKTTLLIYGVSSRCASPQSQRIRIEIFTFYSRELFTRKKNQDFPSVDHVNNTNPRLTPWCIVEAHPKQQNMGLTPTITHHSYHSAGLGGWLPCPKSSTYGTCGTRRCQALLIYRDGYPAIIQVMDGYFHLF